MSVAGNLDWLYHLLGYTLASAGLLLLLWALFWDRSRGRRRCPKCWYDMSGLPGLLCPECGREARKERLFFRTRRRPKGALIGVVVILGAISIPIVAFSTRGWSAMPTAVVIAALELKGWPRTDMGAGPECANEIAKRLRRLSGWQRDFAMRRMARYWAFDYRKDWPAGVPLAVCLADEWWYLDGQSNCILRARLLNGTNGANEWVLLHGGLYRALQGGSPFWEDAFYVLGNIGAGAREAVLELQVAHLDSGGRLSGRPTWSGVVSLPIRVRPSVGDIITPVASEAIEKDIRDGFYASTWAPRDHPYSVFGFQLGGESQAAGVTPSMTVEITRGNTILASTYVWEPSNGNHQLGYLAFGDQWSVVDTLKFNDPTWCVRIRGNPEMALRDFSSTSYWSGEVLIPGNQVRRIPPARWP